MAGYLTLLWPGAVSLISPESVFGNSCSVIMSSVELASVRNLFVASQAAFLSSRLL